MTLRRGIALLATHCGFTEENIDNFSYTFYKDCIRELGIKFNFESISNLYGNGYAGESYTQIQEANPFNYKDKEEVKKNAPKITLQALKDMGIYKDK